MAPPLCDCPPLPPVSGATAAPRSSPADTTGPSGPKPKLRPEVIKLRRERRGQHETIVCEGFPSHEPLDDLVRDLRRACGTGGTVKGRAIEIAGDHRDTLAELLLARGYRSKRAGG